MLVLTIRTDKPEAEAGLYDREKRLAYETWPAHRDLSTTINRKIEEILDSLSISADNLQGIVVFRGPGSFTGLRIGFAVANTLAYSLKIPVVASGGKNWIESGISALQNGKSDKIALPDYGSPANTTKPVK